jgi:fructose-1,6-bisphosphatase
MALAAKTIAREFGQAALVGKLGLVGKQNFTGDAQKKLDIFTNEVIKEAFISTREIRAMWKANLGFFMNVLH